MVCYIIQSFILRYIYWPKPLHNSKFDCAFFIFSFQAWQWFCCIFYISLSSIDETILMRLFHYWLCIAMQLTMWCTIFIFINGLQRHYLSTYIKPLTIFINCTIAVLIMLMISVVFRPAIAPEYSILKSIDYKYWPKPLHN